MASIRQIEANRLNAQKSTGPNTEKGKAISRMNALKTGVYAISETIHGEDTDHLDALSAEYFDRWQPATPEERCLVDTLVRSEWQLRRLAKADSQLWDYEIANVSRRCEEYLLGQIFSNNSTTILLSSAASMPYSAASAPPLPTSSASRPPARPLSPGRSPIPPPRPPCKFLKTNRTYPQLASFRQPRWDRPPGLSASQPW